MDLYPEELKEDPVPVVSLVGAKKYHAALQKNLSVVPSLFDEGQRPIFYILSSEREEGLPKKKKQKSVAPSVVMDDQPGILKGNWMYKNSRVMPAVVVFIFSEWANEKKWKEKEPEFCAFLEKAKTKLRSRNIKTLVALVQRTHSEIIDERLNGFRKRADLDAKKIVFLTKTDMAESAKRLEKAVQVLAAIHYRELSHRKKKQKEKLNKAVQKSLLVRYSFEIGFFAEFRSDTKGALKYYTEAYKNVGAITDDRLRMMEVKIVADYINFKLCKLQFQAKNAYNAVNQFEKHIHAFRSSIGAAEKEYEHWAWVSRQYQVFGELLEKNPSLASVEDRKFFPGFYYQASARYAIDRKNVAKKLCEPIRGSPLYTQYQDTESFSLVGIDRSRQKYVGQVPAVFQSHPLESGAQSKVPGEMDQLYRSLVQELRVDHASLIISLLTKAYTHYKRISSSRVMLQLASLMAHQYLASGKYQDAKDFFDHIAKNYRNEKWWQLLTFTLDSAAQCALQMGLTKDFVEYALELLGPNMSYNIQQKQTIQSQLLSALVSPSTLSLPELKASLQRTPADSLVFCKVHFCEDKVCVGETISFQVMLLSNFPSPLRFHKLRVGFSQNIYDIQVVDPLPATDASAESPLVLQDEYSNLLLLPGVARTYSFEFSAKEKAELQCKNVFLEFGRPSSSICFRWDTPDLILSSGAINNKTTLSKLLSLSRTPERTKMHITALAPEISVNVSQQAPALINEFYAMHLEVLNHEKEKASGLLSFLVDGSYAEEIGFFVGKGSTKEPVQEIEFEEIASKSSFRTTVYVFFPTPGTRNIKFQVSYETVLRSKTTFQESVSVTVQKPFHINYSFYSKDLQPIFNPSSSTSSSATTNTTSPSSIPALSKLAVNEPFFLQVDIQPTTSYYLSVESVSLVLNTNKSLVPVADYLPISSTKTEAIVFNNNKRYSFWFEVVPFVGGDNVNLGVFSMEWKRHKHRRVATLEKHKDVVEGEGQAEEQEDYDNDDDSSVTVIHDHIPALRIGQTPFSVRVDAPPSAEMGQLFTYQLTIENNTNLLQEMTLTLQDHPPHQQLEPEASLDPQQQQQLVRLLEQQGNAFSSSSSDSTSKRMPTLGGTKKHGPSLLCSGDKFAAFTLLPRASYTHTLLLLPLRCGPIALPHLSLFAKRYEVELTDLVPPQSLFVLPSPSLFSSEQQQQLPAGNGDANASDSSMLLLPDFKQ